MAGVGEPTDQYFKSYGNLDVHQLMLNDEARTSTYADFILQNKELFHDKIVLDVGAGCGVLSLFAAKAGAQKVFAVEASPVATICEAVVHRNNFSTTIQVLHTTVEAANLPVKVDVIISEWMGFYLLHESMIQSVLFARDKWLKPEGIILPSEAIILLSPVNILTPIEADNNKWKKLYGFDFSPLCAKVQEQQSTQPVIMNVEEKNLLSSPQVVAHISMKFVELEDICIIQKPFTFNSTQNSVLNGFAVWFNCIFNCDAEGSSKKATEMTLSTEPGEPQTHWKQTFIKLPSSIFVSKEDEITGTIEFKQNLENPRHYNITVMLEDFVGEDEEDGNISPDDPVTQMIFEAINKQ